MELSPRGAASASTISKRSLHRLINQSRAYALHRRADTIEANDVGIGVDLRQYGNAPRYSSISSRQSRVIQQSGEDSRLEHFRSTFSARVALEVPPTHAASIISAQKERGTLLTLVEWRFGNGRMKFFLDRHSDNPEAGNCGLIRLDDQPVLIAKEGGVDFKKPSPPSAIS